MTVPRMFERRHHREAAPRTLDRDTLLAERARIHFEVPPGPDRTRQLRAVTKRLERLQYRSPWKPD
jgi:hypothetical protein